MKRKHIITLHLILAAFLTPILIVIATSGGLYLLGEKGEVSKQTVYQGELVGFNFESKDQQSQVENFLKNNKIEHSFDYVKGNSNFIVTRPTSRPHLTFEKKEAQLTVTKRTPDFVAAIIEIHKGHGSRAMKLFQKAVAICLLIVLLSGLYLGLSSPALKNKTLIISGSGLVSFLLLIFL
jgi:hypothetical protein